MRITTVNLSSIVIVALCPWTQILGVSINPNGYAWLQTVAVNNSVKFVPLLTQSSADYAVCQVFLDNKSRQLVCTAACASTLQSITPFVRTARARFGHVPDQSGLRPGYRYSTAAGRRSTSGAVLYRPAGGAETRAATTCRTVVADVSAPGRLHVPTDQLYSLYLDSLPAPIWPIGQLQALTNNAIHSVTPVKWRLPELVR